MMLFFAANAKTDADDASYDADDLLDIFDAIAYAAADDANGDAKMPNIAHLCRVVDATVVADADVALAADAC